MGTSESVVDQELVGSMYKFLQAHGDVMILVSSVGMTRESYRESFFFASLMLTVRSLV